jgi:hypothetical protein
MLTWFSFLGSLGSRSGELEIDRSPAVHIDWSLLKSLIRLELAVSKRPSSPQLELCLAIVVGRRCQGQGLCHGDGHDGSDTPGKRSSEVGKKHIEAAFPAFDDACCPGEPLALAHERIDKIYLDEGIFSQGCVLFQAIESRQTRLSRRPARRRCLSARGWACRRERQSRRTRDVAVR